jgi:hydroxymethylpyrimidine/phosphomethylpyrimidine kinase
LTRAPARLLIIGGSDSSGGAGIQADIKTATALGVYAMTAITAVTAQDTTGVHAIELMSPALVRAQMLACFEDIGADIVKIGMLGSAEIALTVIAVLREYLPQVVLDTVFTSSSGTALLDEEGIDVLKKEIIPFSTLVTPNIPEIERLTGVACDDVEGMRRAGMALTGGCSKAVLVKGGHGSSDVVTDVFIAFGHATEISHPRQDTRHTHGTGCSYATAIACGMAQHVLMQEAIMQARDFVQSAIAAAPGFGRGNGPLNHLHGISRSR